MYVQDRVEEHVDELFSRMERGAHVYFCGRKRMMPGILNMFEGVCAERGLVWADKLRQWKEAGQWHVEVY